jgi:hypothetical protein
MNRIILALYSIAALVAVLYPVVSEARLASNHNETLLQDRS